MTKDKALDLALEALEGVVKNCWRDIPSWRLDEIIERITAIKQALAAQPAPVQEPSPGGVLFAVEEAIRNGDCPFAIEIAFDAYEAERKALAGINAAPKEGN